MIRRLVVRLLTLLVAAPLAAQQSDRCFFEVEFVGDTGRQVVSPNGVDYFAGGGVRMGCRGTSVRMSADSVAALGGGRVVEFVGRVRYRDSTMTLDADRGTYFKDGERWEARGRVKVVNLRTGSSLAGPSVDYFRRILGLRDTAEVVATGRPTVRYIPAADSGAARSPTPATPEEPYRIVGDRIRTRGDDRVWAAGKVEIRRRNVEAEADSMAFDTGGGWQEGVLVGTRPHFRGMESDTFDLRGRRIDFGLDRREFRVVTAIGEAEALNGGRTLTGDVIRLHVRDRVLRRSLAWSGTGIAKADGPDYAARADSLVFETREDVLSRVLAYRRAWVAAGAADSAATTEERDWIAGDSVVARFRQRDGKTALGGLEAWVGARAFYRAAGDGRAKGGLAYVRGDRITVRMRDDRDEVATVLVQGHVDGIQLEPKAEASKP